jgi:spermidine/putrescine transport system permease protein
LLLGAWSPLTRRLILLGPGLGWLALLLVVPCALVFFMSFFERGTYGGVDYAVATGENYARAFDPLYGGIFLRSVEIAAMTTLLALLIGYPAAAAIAAQPQRRQMALLVLVMLPFWSNYLIRTYAWMVLLNREGLINRALESLGLIGEPLPLLYNPFAIVVGLLYGYLPFMILAIYASLSKLGPEFAEASADLGAGRIRTFLRVTLPLTLPGVAAGSVFVFVLSLGNFITPDLLGGKQTTMIGNVIYAQFLTARDWPFGSALASLLVAIMILLLLGQALLVHRRAPA